MNKSRLLSALRWLAGRIRPHVGAIATVGAMVVGWLLITLGIAAKYSGAVVWPISLGLLCCSLGGWQLIYTIARFGLYALHKDQ